MKHLLAGYQRFRKNNWPGQERTFEVLADQGQAPRALAVACVDSRVDPAMIFDVAPGEMLTVRNVANLVPPYAPDSAYHGTSAAIEFGVKILKIPHIIVLGHGLCGGVQALLNGAPPYANEFIGPWMSIAKSARECALNSESAEERQYHCEHDVIRISLANLMTFPWIAERVLAEQLALHGAWFDVRTGLLLLLQPDGTFAPVE